MVLHNFGNMRVMMIAHELKGMLEGYGKTNNHGKESYGSASQKTPIGVAYLGHYCRRFYCLLQGKLGHLWRKKSHEPSGCDEGHNSSMFGDIVCCP